MLYRWCDFEVGLYFEVGDNDYQGRGAEIIFSSDDSLIFTYGVYMTIVIDCFTTVYIVIDCFSTV